MRGLKRDAVWRASGLPKKEFDRFVRSRRVYLETSAFNHFVDTHDLADLELTRAYQRRKGVVFVASPMLLWEMFLTRDPDRADHMLLAAQALFDPILLATPTELAARYLQHAYPNNVVNYSIFTNAIAPELWPALTTDFGRTIIFDGHVEKARTLQVVSRNLRHIIENLPHEDEFVAATAQIINDVHAALSKNLDVWGMDPVLAKFVILFAYLLLLVPGDLDDGAAQALWSARGYKDGGEALALFVDYFQMFRVGPLLEMAVMATLQYGSGRTNRGAIHDALHMAYAPYVDMVLSNDQAFLQLAAAHPRYARKVFHLSQIDFRRVPLPLADYPDDQRLRFDHAASSVGERFGPRAFWTRVRDIFARLWKRGAR